MSLDKENTHYPTLGVYCLLLPETSDVYLERKLAKPQHHGILKSTYIHKEGSGNVYLGKRLMK